MGVTSRQIQPPIVVDGKGEVLLFRSVEHAEAYMEAIDVRNAEYAVAYDSEGRRLELGTKLVERRFLLGLIRTKIEFADVRPAVDDASCATELAELLRVYLLRHGGGDLSKHSVSELVAMAIDRLGFTA